MVNVLALFLVKANGILFSLASLKQGSNKLRGLKRAPEEEFFFPIFEPIHEVLPVQLYSYSYSGSSSGSDTGIDGRPSGSGSGSHSKGSSSDVSSSPSSCGSSGRGRSRRSRRTSRSRRDGKGKIVAGVSSLCASVHAVVVLLVGVVWALLLAQNLAVDACGRKQDGRLARQFSMLATSQVSGNI